MEGIETIGLESNGFRLEAIERRGRGTPIVLMHGVAGNAWCFKPLIDALIGRHVIALDMPSHGGSDDLRSVDLESLAELVYNAVRTRVKGAAIWGGHSWGGKVAAIVASRHPSAVDSLLLFDPTPATEIAMPPEMAVDMLFAGELGPWDNLDEAHASMQRLPQYAKLTANLAHAFERGLRRLGDGKWQARTSRDDMIAACTALGKDYSSIISKITCPTLMVVADQSLIWQEVTNFPLLSDATRVVIESNHWLMADNPDELHRAVAAWLDDTDEALGADTWPNSVGVEHR